MRSIMTNKMSLADRKLARHAELRKQTSDAKNSQVDSFQTKKDYINEQASKLNK